MIKLSIRYNDCQYPCLDPLWWSPMVSPFYWTHLQITNLRTFLDEDGIEDLEGNRSHLLLVFNKLKERWYRTRSAASRISSRILSYSMELRYSMEFYANKENRIKINNYQRNWCPFSTKASWRDKSIRKVWMKTSMNS